jgi:glycosyltransferase involved in cell wall biosynthesis
MPRDSSKLARIHISKANGAGSREELRNAYAHADAFVLPTRGEGWGLPIVEAMAMAMPVIATNWSGPAAYLTEENSYPVPYTLVETVDGLTTAEPCVVALMRIMREVYMYNGRNDVALRKGVRARRDVVERFSADVVVGVMLERMRHLVDSKQIHDDT